MANAVIFDMDGTILNTLDDLTNSVNYTLLNFGFSQRQKDDIRKFVGNGVNLLFERALPQNTDLTTINQCIDFFKKYYSQNMYNKTAPYQGIIEVLKEIKNDGIFIAVVSNKFDKAVRELCERYFPNLIDISVGQSDEIPPKPSPKGTLKVLSTLNLSDAIFVGDSDVDIMTAKNAYLKSIGVTWGFRDKDNLKDADFIANDPYQLLRIIRSL